MAKNPDKKWDRCLYCDASIKGVDALDAALHDPYCPHGKALVQLYAERVEVARLNTLINNPHTNDFLEAVRTEAAHQRERWGADHDAGKDNSDWFWLLGYLGGKALQSANLAGHVQHEKSLHHIITTAAACLNWHAARTGASTVMRPGIEPPNG